MDHFFGINNDYFTIERSRDGKNFQEAGIVDGAGNSSAPIDYRFTDLYPLPGISYYRLKQTDFNGAFSYSKIVKVNIIKSAENTFSVYPNPAHINFTAQFSSEEILNAQVSIYDMSGKKILSQNFIASEGTNSQNIDIAKIDAGIYIVEFTSGLIKNTLKLIKK
jgi:hypothetical protein